MQKWHECSKESTVRDLYVKSVYRAQGAVQSRAFHLKPMKGIAGRVSLPICLPSVCLGGVLLSNQEDTREMVTLILYISNSYR